MVKLVLIHFVFLQCLVMDCLSKPISRTADTELAHFNATELIKVVRGMVKDPAKFRRMATVSLLTGAIKTEERMELELGKLVDDFIENFNDTSIKGKDKKLREISRFIQRDLRAMFILSSAIDLTHYNASFDEFRKSMREYTLHGEEMSPQLNKNVFQNSPNPEKDLRRFIDDHIQLLRRALMNRVADSMSSMRMEDKNKDDRPLKVLPTGEPVKHNFEVNTIPIGQTTNTTKDPKEGLKEGQKKEKSKGKGSLVNRGIIHQNLPSDITSITYLPYQEEILMHLKKLDRQRRQNGMDDEDFDTEEEEGPGGLVGLIANLSGGEEGSDVAAVIGALAGVVSNIFGPGGLDVNSLLSTGTSLIAGLLGGDENFGKVLGTYFGTALDGFSGGGGADLNGLFVGNLIGAALSGMSADPDDEDENPIKPGTFLRYAFKGYFEPLARPKMPGGDDRRDRGDRENKDREDRDGKDRDDDTMHHPAMGSDVIGFIVGTVKAVIGGALNIIIQSLGGLSNGALKGAMSLSNKVADKVFTGIDDFASIAT